MSTETRIRATMAGFATASALLALLAVGAAGAAAAATRRRRPDNDADAGPPTVTTGPVPAADRRFDVDVPRRRSGRRLRQAELGRGLRGHGRRDRRHHGLQGARDGEGGDPAHLVRADGDRRPPPPRQLADDTGRMLSDEWYSPYLLRVDEAPEHLQAGATWTINYMKTKTTSSKPTDDDQPGRDLDRRRRRHRHRGAGGHVQRAQGHAHRHRRRVDQDAVVRPRRRQGPRAHRRRPLRRADRLHHRPVADPVPSAPLAPRSGERVRVRGPREGATGSRSPAS